MRVLLFLALLVLAGCAAQAGGDTAAGGSTSDAADGGVPDPAAGGISQAENDLLVEVDHGDGSPPESWALVCVGSVDGSHPRAQEACDHLHAMDDPFAPLPADVMCTEQYGGPQTAHVTGLWGGEPVDLRLSRVDGCHISQWDGLGPLLGDPLGPEPVG